LVVPFRSQALDEACTIVSAEYNAMHAKMEKEAEEKGLEPATYFYDCVDMMTAKAQMDSIMDMCYQFQKMHW